MGTTESPRSHHSSRLDAGGSWPLWGRVAVSLLIGFHMFAICLGVLAAPPSSELEKYPLNLVRNYHGFLNQGYTYRFYARLDTTVDIDNPRPWGTPIIHAEMAFASPEGETTVRTFRLPDRNMLWPRLRFQRQLDLAYHLAADPRWAASYARHLSKVFNCSKITLFSQIHTIPNLDSVRRSVADPTLPPVDFEADDTYSPRVKLGEFECSDL